MPQRKTYRSIVYKDLDTYVLVNGNKILISFRGGSLQPPINGIFTTADPDLIAAMDKDRGNGVSFRCVISEGEPDEQKQTGKQKAQKAEDKQPEKTEDAPKDLKEVPGIATLQDARNYLLALKIEGVTPSKVNTTAQVKKCAALNGINFTDLK